MSAIEPDNADAIREHNRRAWDALVERGQRFTTPAKDDDVSGAAGTVAGDRWLDGGLAGQRLLCLAAGGGRQSMFYAAAGAVVTVVDVSPAMIALDRQVAAERGLNIRAVCASMDDLSAFAQAEFDVVIQPVSSCYLPDVTRIYREVSRVLSPGGLYISQHKQPTSLQAEIHPTTRGYEVTTPYDHRGPLPPVIGSPHREEGTLEFLHGWQDLIGGLCRAGFVIEDLLEPKHGDAAAAIGSFAHRSRYAPPYVRIKARRVATQDESRAPAGQLWTPE
ncbi:MAG TPA: class I SAM-dependent methyltransferase [Pirellulales bacterium]|jgi:SAM-dependent methyltransferase